MIVKLSLRNNTVLFLNIIPIPCIFNFLVKLVENINSKISNQNYDQFVNLLSIKLAKDITDKLFQKTSNSKC